MPTPPRDVSEGNPFFALELARALRESGFNPEAGQELPVPQTLRSLVQGRLGQIPAAERHVLLAVAALASPTRDLLVSFAGAMDNGWPPLITAFESKIIEVVDGRIRFTHPLLGSILYADTALPVRQRGRPAPSRSTKIQTDQKGRRPPESSRRVFRSGRRS